MSDKKSDPFAAFPSVNKINLDIFISPNLFKHSEGSSQNVSIAFLLLFIMINSKQIWSQTSKQQIRIKTDNMLLHFFNNPNVMLHVESFQLKMLYEIEREWKQVVNLLTWFTCWANTIVPTLTVSTVCEIQSKIFIWDQQFRFVVVFSQNRKQN